MPGTLLGRLFGAFTAITGLGLPLGSLAAGALSTAVSLRALIALGGAACVALGGLALAVPTLRRLPDLNLAREGSGGGEETS